MNNLESNEQFHNLNFPFKYAKRQKLLPGVQSVLNRLLSFDQLNEIYCELLNKRDKNVEIRIGNLIQFRDLKIFDSDTDMTAYLRQRTYILSHREDAQINHRKKKNAYSSFNGEAYVAAFHHASQHGK